MSGESATAACESLRERYLDYVGSDKSLFDMTWIAFRELHHGELATGSDEERQLHKAFVNGLCQMFMAVEMAQAVLAREEFVDFILKVRAECECKREELH